MTDGLPDGLLLSWYGDDFTGSAAVMEVLTFGGLPSVLFLKLPTPVERARFPDARAIGIAGMARSQNREWMNANLPPIFEFLAGIDVPIAHYKICSTLDSSPEIGSIGHAMDLAEPFLGGLWYPVLVAAPANGRYQVFGNLFASHGSRVHRLDRHPVMSRHPTTPMRESDVGLHLSLQMERGIERIDLPQLRHAGEAESVIKLAQRNRAAVLVDAIDESDLVAAGRLIWTGRGERLLVVGSQGIEYALLAYWRSMGWIEPIALCQHSSPAHQLVAVSGSVSATTAQQIARAEADGFVAIPLDCSELLKDNGAERLTKAAILAGLQALSDGKSVVIYTARGPDDPTVRRFQAALTEAAMPATEIHDLLGAVLGDILKALLQHTGLRRAVIAGGDTSGRAVSRLGIFAFTALAPTVPGAALLLAHSHDPQTDQLEIGLKGGQMGSPDYFVEIRDI